VIPKSNNPSRITANFDCLFKLDDRDFKLIDNLVGDRGEHGIRNHELLHYVGFDNYNEEIEEP